MMFDALQSSCRTFLRYLKINKIKRFKFKSLEYKNFYVKKPEKLIKKKSINVSFNELQKIHEKWKEIGPVLKKKEIFGMSFKKVKL